MSGLLIRDVTKKFGPVVAVEDVSVQFARGELVCFLGPSGCGKTTLLRLIAGLEVPTRGTISFNGHDLTRTPVHQRDIGMVFQSFALFPHLDVGGNIAYPMRIRGYSRADCEARVKDLLEMMRLPGFADRPVSRLSGGQRQRVAIARALALDPSIFLLDEPMSALDANLREAMQIELRKLQQDLGITTVVVTHDQTEAMTMADRIVVMGRAKVLQSGTPMEIYRNPADRFVAGFIGTSNLLPVQRTAPDRVRIGGTELRFAAPGGGLPAHMPAGMQDVLLMTRPEEVVIHPATAEKPDNAAPGTVTFVRDIGATIEIMAECHGHEVISVLMPKDRPDVRVGDAVHIEMPAAACSILAA